MFFKSNKKVVRQASDWPKIFAIQIYEKGEKIYMKKDLYVESRKKKNSLKIQLEDKHSPLQLCKRLVWTLHERRYLNSLQEMKDGKHYYISRKCKIKS